MKQEKNLQRRVATTNSFQTQSLQSLATIDDRPHDRITYIY